MANIIVMSSSVCKPLEGGTIEIYLLTEPLKKLSAISIHSISLSYADDTCPQFCKNAWMIQEANAATI